MNHIGPALIGKHIESFKVPFLEHFEYFLILLKTLLKVGKS